MNELSLTAPTALAAKLEAERYGIEAGSDDPASVYGRIADVLSLELDEPAASPPEAGRRPRQRRSMSRSVWAALASIERLRALVRRRGACQDSGVEFFPDEDELPEDVYERACDLALSVCDGCPVRVECLELALRTDERFGIWGGMTADDRALEAARRANRLRLSEREAS
jgi:WhiB family transcriptional regulator, redox-sensing transcriptional regulator